MDQSFASFADIIDALGGPTPFARAIGVTPLVAHGMKRRRSIPMVHWLETIRAAERAGIKLTTDDLVKIGIEQSCRMPKRSAREGAR